MNIPVCLNIMNFPLGLGPAVAQGVFTDMCLVRPLCPCRSSVVLHLPPVLLCANNLSTGNLRLMTTCIMEFVHYQPQVSTVRFCIQGNATIELYNKLSLCVKFSNISLDVVFSDFSWMAWMCPSIRALAQISEPHLAWYCCDYFSIIASVHTQHPFTLSWPSSV